MINGTAGVDSGTLSQSAQQMGDILMSAHNKKNDLIESILGVQTQAKVQGANPPGIGENVDAVA